MELSPLEVAGGDVCSAAPCRQQQLGQEAAARRQAQHEFTEAMAERARQFVAAQSDLPQESVLSLAIVPVNTRALTRLPDERKQQFLGHLRTVMAEEEQLRELPASELTTPFSVPEPVEPTPSAEQDQILGLSCAVCRGHCCRQGVEHAFQDVPSMRRIRETFGEASPAELAAGYAARLPTESYAESCVFHTEQGCNLPREMRSDMCNSWICAGQHRWLAELPRQGPLLGYVVATPDYQPRAIRTALVGAKLADEDHIGLRNDLAIEPSSSDTVEKNR